MPATRAVEPVARRERGAVAIEAALLTPLLVLLFFGIIEFGMLFKDYLAVTSSVRAGTRMASAEPRIAGFAQDAADQVAKEGSALDMDNVDELWVYKASRQRLPGRRATARRSTPARPASSSTGTTATKKFVAVRSHHLDCYLSRTPASATRPPDSIGVYMKFTYQGVTGLIFNEMPLEEHSVMSLEPIPTTKTCK